jgi:peptidoglycan/LPS O-acetylase OafA/YrhL
MKSSGGAYYAGLDHVRALAAFLVVTWHFSHWGPDYPVPLDRSPLLGPFDEGHLGVSVFMVLSGYLFAKLIGDRSIRYLPFLWNRAIRLLPLLAVVLYLYAVQRSLAWGPYLVGLAKGAILPTLPNAAWSITIEVHFYLLLPLLLAILRPRPKLVLVLIAASIALRVALYLAGFDIQLLAYETILGRFDQFAFGIAAYRLRDLISGRIALSALALLWGSYGLFDWMGGYYHFPTPVVWILLPTLEGLTIAPMIAWYDRNPLRGRKMWLVGKAGEYSYSIYLLHFFFVAQAAAFIDTHVMRMPDMVHALPWAAVFFLAMTAIGHVSWRLIEEPPLRLRVPYFSDAESRGSRRGEARMNGLPTAGATQG